MEIFAAISYFFGLIFLSQREGMKGANKNFQSKGKPNLLYQQSCDLDDVIERVYCIKAETDT